MIRFRRGETTTLLKFHVFGVEKLDLHRDDGSVRPVLRISTPDWCNVVPLTDDGRVVLVRQHRWGTDAPSLEIPGGLVDPGETPIDAARRELHEETGYDAASIVELGRVHPNPAIQSNELHMFLARGCTPHSRGQQLEELDDCEVVLLDRAQLEAAIDRAEITHALVLAAVLAWRRLEDREKAARP